MFRWYKKYVKIGIHGMGALLIIGVAVLLRILLIAQGWPGMSSDEGTMGLEAMHIAYRGELPIYFYGQSYMGTIEAYLAAGMYHLFGVSSFSLRLGMVFLFALFLLVMYLLTCLLYTKNVALISIALLCFGSNETFMRQLRVLGGDSETMLFGPLILLIACWLALSLHAEATPAKRKKRHVMYGCLGFVMGLAIWSHFLVLPFVLVTLVLLLLFCRSEIRTRATSWLLIGIFIGLLPFLIFNIEHPDQNSIATLWALHMSGGTAISLPHSFWDQILGAILVSIPQASGASPLCPIPTLAGEWKQQISSCMIFQGSWGVAFIVLLIIATIAAVFTLPQWRATFNPPSTLAMNERQHLVRHTARLCLLGAAILTLLAYVFSPAPALVPITSSRYLIALLMVIPALIWPLCSHICLTRPVSFSSITSILKLSVLLFIFVVFASATMRVFQQVPVVEKTTQQQYSLVDDLLHIGAVHIYSDYETCDRVIFQSEESIICSVLDNNLHTGQNRYLPYQAIVQNDPNAAYVFPVGSPQDEAFAHRMATSRVQYQRFVFEGYNSYQPGRAEHLSLSVGGSKIYDRAFLLGRACTYSC